MALLKQIFSTRFINSILVVFQSPTGAWSVRLLRHVSAEVTRTQPGGRARTLHMYQRLMHTNSTSTHPVTDP